MEIWAGINAPAGRRKTKGLVCSQCKMDVCVRAWMCASLYVKPGAHWMKYYSTKAINLINIFFRGDYLKYLHENTNMCSCVKSNAAGKENESGLWQYKEKMNTMANRKIKRIIVWERHAFIILIGSVLCRVHVCMCVCVCVCDWCGVLCCMSRWVIGLLIFPLAEHKSLFYPPSLNLSRVKCLRSQLLTVFSVCVCVRACVYVCVCLFLHIVCGLSKILL